MKTGAADVDYLIFWVGNDSHLVGFVRCLINGAVGGEREGRGGVYTSVILLIVD